MLSFSASNILPSTIARAIFHSNHVWIPTATRISSNTTKLPKAMNRNKTVSSSCADISSESPYCRRCRIRVCVRVRKLREFHPRESTKKWSTHCVSVVTNVYFKLSSLPMCSQARYLAFSRAARHRSRRVAYLFRVDGEAPRDEGGSPSLRWDRGDRVWGLYDRHGGRCDAEDRLVRLRWGSWWWWFGSLRWSGSLGR